MPWRQTSPMDRKAQFIADYLRRTLSTTEVCERYHVSGQTGDTGLERYLNHDRDIAGHPIKGVPVRS
jgi:transposase